MEKRGPVARGFLDGRTCLVTGGAQGVGWALCQALADHGAQVHACDISEASLARARGELVASAWEGAIHLARCDVTERRAVTAWIEDVQARTGRVDVLVNNAVFVRFEDVVAMSVEDAERTMRVGYDAMLYATKAVLPLMLAAGGGHIVNMGSSLGRIFTRPSSAAYSATKAAIAAYTQVLQLELEGTPVGTTLVRPGTIAGTEFFQKQVPSTVMPRAADFLPPLSPPEVARAIVRAIQRRKPVLDIPGYLPPLYLFYALMPRLFRKAMTLGGRARSDFGKLEWRYGKKEGER